MATMLNPHFAKQSRPKPLPLLRNQFATLKLFKVTVSWGALVPTGCGLSDKIAKLSNQQRLKVEAGRFARSLLQRLFFSLSSTFLALLGAIHTVE